MTSTPLWSKNFHPMMMCFLDSTKTFETFFCDTIHNRAQPRKYLTGADLNQTGPVFLRPWQLNWEASAGLRGYIDPVPSLLYDWGTLHFQPSTQHHCLKTIMPPRMFWWISANLFAWTRFLSAYCKCLSVSTCFDFMMLKNGCPELT